MAREGKSGPCVTGLVDQLIIVLTPGSTYKCNFYLSMFVENIGRPWTQESNSWIEVLALPFSWAIYFFVSDFCVCKMKVKTDLIWVSGKSKDNLCEESVQVRYHS